MYDVHFYVNFSYMLFCSVTGTF